MQTKDMSAKEQCCALLCHLEEKRAGIFDSSKHLTLPSARIFLSLPRSQWKTYNCTIFFMVLFCCRCFAFVWLLSFVLSRCMFINSQFLFRLNNNICGQWVRNFSCFFSVLLFLSKEQQIRKMTTEKKVRKSSKSKERVERFRQSRTFRPNKQLFCVVQYENSLICPSFRIVRARFSCFLVCCLEYICKAYSPKHTHRDRQCEWWECSVCVCECEWEVYLPLLRPVSVYRSNQPNNAIYDTQCDDSNKHQQIFIFIMKNTFESGRDNNNRRQSDDDDDDTQY